MPENLEAVVTEFDPDGPDAWSVLPTGERLPAPLRRLSDVVAKHGWTFTLGELYGEQGRDALEAPVVVSLEEFRGRDLENTWVKIGYRRRPVDLPEFCYPETGPIVP